LVTLVKTVGESGRSRLVDDTENVESGDGTGVLCGGTLSVVEVCRNGDYCIGDFLAEVALSNLLHLAQDHGGDLLRGESLLLSANLDANARLTVLVDDLEGKVLDVVLRPLDWLSGWSSDRTYLNVLVVELATDHTLDVKYSPRVP